MIERMSVLYDCVPMPVATRETHIVPGLPVSGLQAPDQGLR